MVAHVLKVANIVCFPFQNFGSCLRFFPSAIPTAVAKSPHPSPSAPPTHSFLRTSFNATTCSSVTIAGCEFRPEDGVSRNPSLLSVDIEQVGGEPTTFSSEEETKP